MSEKKNHFCLFTLCSNDTLDKLVKKLDEETTRLQYN